MNKFGQIITKAFTEQDEDFIVQRREVGKILDIPVADIKPNPAQPRQHFSIEELTGLAKSISKDGIIQPISVRQTNTGYELISGERRLRAAKIAGLRSVPCIIINVSDERSAIIALIENIQREDLNCFEEAAAIDKLIKQTKMTQEEIAVRLGLAQSTVANKLRLLKLSDEEQRAISSNGLTERHARALLRIDQEDDRKIVLAKAIEGKWTVETTEKYITKMQREKNEITSYKKRAVMLKDVRLFFNTVNKAVNVMKMAGVDADTKRIDHEDYIEYIIKIPSPSAKNTQTQDSPHISKNLSS